MRTVIRLSEDLPSIDDLDRAIVTLATRINAETYEMRSGASGTVPSGYTIAVICP